MNFSTIKNKLRYVSFFIPFRFQLILLSAALLLAYVWLKKSQALPETSYTAITNLFISVALVFIAAIFIISFFTAIIPWLLFLINKKTEKASIKIKTAPKNTLTEKQPINFVLSNIVRPLFGYIRLRIAYDQKRISPKFLLLRSDSKKGFFSSTYNGTYNWLLPQIKEYQVSKTVIYFEDMFQLFSFTATLPVNGNFFTQPKETGTNEMNVKPKKTEETNIRIDQIRKVEGEFLNYKNFENNDDVRRIVWKIYAKNKELVVRVPETNDPYASHVYFYASFYNAVNMGLYDDFNTAFLNYFKTITWNAYQQLNKQNVLIKYIPDQEVKAFLADDELEKIKYNISTSQWQTQKDLHNYFKKEQASVLCISSLTDADQALEIIENAGKDLVIIFAEVSRSFKKTNAKDWLQWIFINPGKEGIDKMRLAWDLSPLKRKIIENEMKIKQMLEKSDCEKIIV